MTGKVSEEDVIKVTREYDQLVIKRQEEDREAELELKKAADKCAELQNRRIQIQKETAERLEHAKNNKKLLENGKNEEERLLEEQIAKAAEEYRLLQVNFINFGSGYEESIIKNQF